MKKLTIIFLFVFMAACSICFSQENNSKESKATQNSRPGLMNITELNFGIGLYKIKVDYARRIFNLTSILDIGLTKNLIGGIGIGASLYNGGTLFPLFADFRYFFSIKKTRVFILGDGGVLLNSGKNVSGTMIFVNPGAGVVFPVSNNLSLSCGAGLFTQFRQDYDHDSFANIKLGMTYLFKKGFSGIRTNFQNE